MRIKRLRVEEGFFDGLDIEFSEGLNVLIGGRGVGKTGVIELIRFGLGVEGLTATSNEDSLAHALAILKSGQVFIDLESDDKSVTVCRSANDIEPRADSQYTRPIIFSQTEIESVGLDAMGRLKLIDSFGVSARRVSGAESELNSRIRSLSAAITDLRKDIVELEERTSTISTLEKSEKEYQNQQKKISTEDKEVQKLQVQLDGLQKDIGAISVDDENISALDSELRRWRSAIGDAISEGAVRIPAITNETVADLVAAIRDEIKIDISSLSKIESRIDAYLEKLAPASGVLRQARVPLEDKARELRKTVEKHKKGAGQISRELGKIREELARLRSLEITLKENWNTLKSTFNEIVSLCESVEKERKTIFNVRKGIVDELNEKLGPTITAKIRHLARVNDYEAALKDVLRGSGLKYNEVAPAIASRMSPLELFHIVQELDYEGFAETIDIPLDRATRLVSYLSENDMGAVLCARLYDDIELFLYDGLDYKRIDDLSIGQRCTVALSIVMENKSRVLLVDQPEDHLDNEFIAATLIQALVQRESNAQTIVSSHNANIPVLGNAEAVIHLDSNGRRGYSKCAGPLDSPDVVDAIETIMEGGKEAFEKRAEFYRDT